MMTNVTPKAKIAFTDTWFKITDKLVVVKKREVIELNKAQTKMSAKKIPPVGDLVKNDFNSFMF